MTWSRVLIGSFVLISCAGAAIAQPANEPETRPASRFKRSPVVEIPGAPVPVVDPQSGVAVDHPTVTRWQYMCGSDLTSVNDRTLREVIDAQNALFAPGQPVIVVDTPHEGPATRATGLNVVFVLAGTVPANAVPAFTRAEQYFEDKFTNNITITINVAFQSLQGGVIGATGSNFVNNVQYSTSRTRLTQGTAPSAIQNFLPTGSSLPVRFDGASTTVSNVGTVNWTVGNARAAGVTGGTGVVAGMTYNTNMNFDFDPSNGVTGSALSLVDTIVHEVGHAMGFVSAADSGANIVETMDLFRFQRTNTGGTWNPTSTGTFQTLPRLVDNNTPDDDHIVDFGTVEYRMSDGNPWQASHFREQSSNIGIMDPALTNGQTFYPNYFKTSDLTVFKAMGWTDLPPCTTTITEQPSPTSVAKIAGQTVNFNVGATTDGTGEVSYLWLKNGVPVSGANARYTGITSDSMTIDPIVAGDVGTYTCQATSSCGSTTSNGVALTVAARCAADRDDGQSSGRPDGAVTIDDLLYFLVRFEAGTTEADLDNGGGFGFQDGAVTIDDLLYFLVHFEAGC